jgi:glycolate oxidase iron-sulfur subunit
MIDALDPSIYNACIRCGLCLPSCPTYLETMTETSGPRGRISLIKAVAESRLDVLSDGFVEQMHQCLDCRACEAVCPSGVRYGRLVETARAHIRRAQAPHDAPAQRFARSALLRWLFTDSRRMRAAARLLRLAQRTRLLAFAKLVGLEATARLAPDIPATFYRLEDRRYETPGATGLAFMHTGCIMPIAFPEVHEATVRMLQRAGLSVDVPAEQGCCGAIAVHAGEPAIAAAMAKRNIVAFERSGADVYVANAAGCGSALKEYGELLGSDPQWAEQARQFSARVRDVTEVLDAMELSEARRSIDGVVTYQDACHLVHAQRVAGAPRRLLAKIPALRYVELDESAVCCGSAGIYNLTEPEMAMRLRRRKIEAIARTGATVVVTANPGCAIQIKSGLREAGYTARVVHIVELLDEAYKRA